MSSTCRSSWSRSRGSFIKGATGVGLPQIAIAVMAVFLGVERSVVVMAIPGVVANGWLVWTHRDTARSTRDLPTLVATAVAGAIVGTMLLKTLDGQVLSGVLAAVIFCYIAIALPLGSRAARRLSPATFQKMVLVLVAASAVSLLHQAISGGGS